MNTIIMYKEDNYMIICRYCGRDMQAHTSCYPKIMIDGRMYDRIRYGDEKYKYHKNHEPVEHTYCPDCGCRVGTFHHFECDQEQNPANKQQMLMSTFSDSIFDVIKE